MHSPCRKLGLMAEASKCVNIVTYPTKMTQRETDLVIESITPVSPNRRHHVVGFYGEFLLNYSF